MKHMMAGINTPATENGVTAPKWTFVRTHTARRSAGTNLALQGVPWILLLSWAAGRSWRC